MNIGERIYNLRVSKNVTQGDLAKSLNMSVSVLNRIELGSRPLRAEEVILAAKFFGVTTDFLLGVGENENEQEITTWDFMKEILKDDKDLLDILSKGHIRFDGTYAENGRLFAMSDSDKELLVTILRKMVKEVGQGNKRIIVRKKLGD